ELWTVVKPRHMVHFPETIFASDSSVRKQAIYYLFTWLLQRVFGEQLFLMRYVSALAGTLAVVGAFAAGRRLWSWHAGVMAAAFVAVNPLMVHYSRDGRSYALAAAAVLW